MFSFLLVICLGVGCSKEEPPPQAEATPPGLAAPGPKLLVLATIAPMYCFTKNIAGDLADVEMIVPPGADSRGFEPSPAQVRRILQADVVIENGFGYEGWMDRLVAAGLRPGELRVIAAAGTGPPIPGVPGDPNTPPGEGPADPSKPPDPHVWLDPLMAIKEVQNIADALMKRDPAHADAYFANESHYTTALRDMDDETGNATLGLAGRPVLCATEAFSYFLSRYEIPVAGNVAAGARALLEAKPVAPGAKGFPMPVIVLDPMERGPASADFYENTTRANVRALVRGLSQ